MPAPKASSESAPLSEAVIAALSRLVDDAQLTSRQPTHSQIEEQFDRADLKHVDPNLSGRPVGKAKRIRGVLQWAIEHDVDKGERLVSLLVSLVRGVGSFRQGSENFVGCEAVTDLRAAFASEGVNLTENGELVPVVLEGLSCRDLTEALRAYVRRARQGVPDAALITGTGKDLVEAVAAHVISRRYGSYETSANFPTLVGQAFVAVGLCAMKKESLTAQEQMQWALYELACAVNRLRNRQGTGHGRPFPATVTPLEARTAVEGMGLVCSVLLDALGE